MVVYLISIMVMFLTIGPYTVNKQQFAHLFWKNCTKQLYHTKNPQSIMISIINLWVLLAKHGIINYPETLFIKLSKIGNNNFGYITRTISSTYQLFVTKIQLT